MSLDVYLTELQPVNVYDGNITHNLGSMASAAGIYDACWRPEALNITKAEDLIPLLHAGLAKLKEQPEHFRQFNADNGWGIYEDFVRFVEEYLAACIKHPNAHITVSR